MTAYTNAIQRLDEIAVSMSDAPEAAHSAADQVLLDAVDPEVAAAYDRVVNACAWWSTA